MWKPSATGSSPTTAMMPAVAFPVPLAPFAAALAVLLLATDRRIVRKLRAQGAREATQAVDLRPPGPFGAMRLRRLIALGAIRETNGRYYLDEDGWAAWRRRRRLRGLLLLGLLAAVLGVLALVRIIVSH